MDVREAPRACRRRVASTSLAVALGFALAVPAASQTQHPFHAGFPVVLTGQGNVVFSTPVVAELGTLGSGGNLGTAGVKEIVFGTVQGELHVLHRLASTGAWVEAPGFPVVVGNYIASSPAVGNLTDAPPCNAGPEIVVGHGDVAGAPQGPGGVKAYCNNGALLWQVASRDKIPGGGPDAVNSAPAIGDVDGNPGNEVAWGGLDSFVHLVDGATGVYESGWPLFLRDSMWSSPALHDIDNDGRADVIIGVDAHDEMPTFPTPDGGCLHVLRFNASQTCSNPSDPATCTMPNNIAGFPICIDQTIFSSPSVGDIDGDGQPEIVHGTGTFWPNRNERVYAWNCDGTAVAGWPVTIQGQVSTSPALGNLDADAALEVVVTADNTRSSTTFHLYAFNGNGTQVFTPKQVLDWNGVSFSAKDPVIADVLGGTTTPEILVPTNTSVTAYDASGNVLTDVNGFTAPNPPSFYSTTGVFGTAVADLENDGLQIEVVAISGRPFPGAANTEVNVWNPVNRSTVAVWGHFRQDVSRMGVAPGTSPCGNCAPVSSAASNFFTLTPCRAVDTRSGSPLPLVSTVPRTFSLTSCGVPMGARAASINVTVTQPTGAGFVRFGPGLCPLPNTSTINFSAGQTRANNAVAPIDAQGRVKVEAFVQGGGTVHLIIDVNGYTQ